jgi:DNA-binding PadR family transcriptional regulator
MTTMPREADRDPRTFLPLKPDVFVILTLLAEEERHGYGIMQAAEVWSGGGMEIQAGALYRRLKWMLGEGLICESDPCDTESGERDRRRFYQITDLGRQVARAEALRMRGLLMEAGRVDLISDAEAV